jgi:hypothetical protein
LSAAVTAAAASAVLEEELLMASRYWYCTSKTQLTADKQELLIVT